MDIPQHVGIIIDGNRRWATEKGMSKLEGHRYGFDALKKLLPYIIKRGVPVLSVFAFSTENWKRTEEEVGMLMRLIGDIFRDHFKWLKEEGVQVRVSGRMSDFSPELQKIFETAVEDTKTNTKLIGNFCLSYGGREELTQAVQRIAEETKGDPALIAAIDESTVEQHLYTAGLPDVDLLIRTGGEKRLSGFLPWQSTYAELYFTDIMWPDFNEAEFDKALEFFGTRKRNFGK